MPRSKKSVPANATRKAVDTAVKVAEVREVKKVTSSFGKLPENRVTTKRLSRLSDGDRKKALGAFEKGVKTVSDLAKEYGLKESNVRYSILSEKVRNGSVAPLSATDVRALKASLAKDGAAVTATRAGISGTKLRELTA